MSKRDPKTIIPTRYLPAGSRRIRKADGTRVWFIGDKEYPSKRAYFESGDWKPQAPKVEAQVASAAEIMDDPEFTEADAVKD